MNKLFSRFSVLMLVCILLVGMILPTNALAQIKENNNKEVNFDYPIKPGTDEWFSINGHATREKMCQIPEDILKNISTNKLVDLVLNYPFYGAIYMYDSYEKGFKALKSSFNGIRELLERDDAASIILKKYQQISIEDMVNKGSVFDVRDVEILLTQPQILMRLNEVEVSILKDESFNKYSQIKDNNYSSTYSLFYNTFSTSDSVTAKPHVVKTPAGTEVTIYNITSPDYNEEEIKKAEKWVLDRFPDVTILEPASVKYNCHGYAWYSQSEKYWMQDDAAEVYMSDKSYRRLIIRYDPYEIGVYEVPQEDDKIFYIHSERGKHSGVFIEVDQDEIILPPTLPGIPEKLKVVSKWGAYGLVLHSPVECWWYEDNSYHAYTLNE